MGGPVLRTPPASHLDHPRRGAGRKKLPHPEALCTLTSRLLPTDGLTASTDYKGHFEFNGLQPGEYSLLCAASGHQPLKRTLEIANEPAARLAIGLAPAGGDRPDGGGARAGGKRRHGRDSGFFQTGWGAASSNPPLVETEIQSRAALPSRCGSHSRRPNQHQRCSRQPRPTAGQFRGKPRTR